MLKSMTAFASLEFEHGPKRVSIELRSVNHRFFDLRIKSPSGLLHAENQIRKILKDKLERGSIDCFIRVKHVDTTTTDNKKLSIDWPLIDQYMVALDDIKKKYKITDDLRTGDILRMRDILNTDDSDDKSEDLNATIVTNISKCADSMLKMQLAEGGALKKTMLELLAHIESNTDIIYKKVENTYKEIFKRLSDKITILLDTPQISHDRIVTEAGLLAQKADIKEEIDRIHSHVAQFRNETTRTDNCEGKKLDFIVQELNREFNTIASKSEDKDVVYLTVETKSLIEKIREQVQNVK